MVNSTNKKIGNEGEDRAASFLASIGYTILYRNWRTRRGEVDIIASMSDVLVFIEVKTWPRGDFFSLAEAVDEVKQKRIIETAKCFMLEHRQYNNCFIRFDIVAIDMPGQAEVYHIENAFSENI